MRLGLVILLSLLMTGCALWRKDKEEPVENRQEREQAEPVLKPSEALKPRTSALASPISDDFYMRVTAFQGSVDTQIRVDSEGAPVPDGTLLSGEEDLGLDDTVEQARMEFNIRMADRHNVRIDYFKLDRFQQVPLERAIGFGDFDFDAGDMFRTELDYRTLSVTYTYSLLKMDRFEWGIGLGAYIFDLFAKGGQPGTLDQDEYSEAKAFPTAATHVAYRISNRWAATARLNQLDLSEDEAEGGYQEIHADIQYRWRKNFAIGLGYTSLNLDLAVDDDDDSFLFNMDTSGPELFFRAAF